MKINININKITNYELIVYIFLLVTIVRPIVGFSNNIRIIIGIVMIVMAFYKATFIDKYIKNNLYIKMYIILIAWSTLSLIYSFDTDYSLVSLSNMCSIFIISLSVIILISDNKKNEDLFKFFAFIGLLLFFILFFEKSLNVSTRLGYEMNVNPNFIAQLVMPSLLTSIWLFTISVRRKKVFYLGIIFATGYIEMLTGGRKYIIAPLLFIYLLYILRVSKDKFIRVFRYTILSILILIGFYQALLTVPVLYNTIGSRMQETVNIVKVNRLSSKNVYLGMDQGRLDMIGFGIKLFKEHPFWGWGEGTYRKLNKSRGIRRDIYSHNNYIEILVNLGIFGFIIYYVYILALIKRLMWLHKKKSLLCKTEKELNDFWLAYVIIVLFLDWGMVNYNELFFTPMMLSLASGYTSRRSLNKQDLDI